MRKKMIALAFVIGLTTMFFFWRPAMAATATLVPNSDVTSAWPACSTACSAMMQYSYVDEGTSTNVTDWIGTGTNGAGGEVVEFGLTSTTGVEAATQVDVRATLRSATINSTADTVGFALRVNGTLQAVNTVTMTTTWTNYATTFTGNWTQADVDSMQIYLIRNVVGTGPASGRDDDVQIANTYATLTYTQTVQFEQSAYRWFNNQDASAGPTFVKAAGGTGDDGSYTMIQTSDGGHATIGYTTSFGAGGWDMLLTKYDAAGTPSWSRAWGGTGTDVGRSLVQTSDGGYAVTGYTASYGGGGNDMFLAKYDSAGTLSWNRTWGGTGTEIGLSLVQTSDGGYAISGETTSYGNGGSDMFLAKYNSAGTLSWSRTWGNAAGDRSWHMVQTSDGGFAITGQTASYGAGVDDMFLAKYDSAGTLSWSRTWGGTGTEWGYSLTQTSDGGYAVTGYTTSYGAGGEDVFLVKYDSAGTLAWNRVWGGTGSDRGYSLIQDSDGGFLVTGHTASYGSGGNDMILVKYDSAGTLAWNRVWGGTGSDRGLSLMQTGDSGYIVTGFTASYGAGLEDVFLAKHDSSGIITGCSSPMCQSPTATTSSPTATTSSPTATTSSPTAATSSPTATTSSPTLSASAVVAMSPTVDVGSPLATQDAAVSAMAGSTVRLRLGLHVATGQADPGAVNLKLQYVAKGSGTCAAPSGGTPSAYTDVTNSTIVAYANNSLAVDGQGVSTNVNDPVHSGHPIVGQTYEESNVIPIANTITTGQDGLWDFALNVSGSAPYNESYCFRLVQSSGAVLGTYSVYPEVTIPEPALTQANYRWYDNADSTSPGTPLAAQDTPTSTSTETPFRMRQRIAVDNGQAVQSRQNFKLQYAEKVGVCDTSFSGEAYIDVGGPASETNNAGTVVNDVSYGSVGWSNPGNATTDDAVNAVATMFSSTSTHYLKSSSHGFSIPGGATINGIEVIIDRSSESDFLLPTEDTVAIVKGGAVSSTNRATSEDWTNATGNYGGPTDLWGEVWTPADINSSGFGVAASVLATDDSTAYVDHIAIKVYYTLSTNLSYYANPTPVHNTSISALGGDPTNAGRATVLQTYLETNPFTNNIASIAAGSDGLWDFALTSTVAAGGKTYCLRVAKSDGGVLDTYNQIPEITIGSGGQVVPTLEQQTRGGKAVVGGVKTPFSW